jgi:uncharacterized protein YecE (DUF72 family)
MKPCPFFQQALSVKIGSGFEAMELRVGTSGWSYDWWRGLFYPEELPSREWLAFYGRQFSTVEVNMTFYRIPRPDLLKAWAEKTPPGFKFTLKAPKRITHLKKLKDVGPEVADFSRLAGFLGHKLAGLLYQLPPSLSRDLELLKDFLAILSPAIMNVVEFRHPSWYGDDTAALLRDRGAVFCSVSSAKMPPDIVLTTPAVYVRFHGLAGGHRYNYRDEELRDWADRIRGAGAREGYAYFNNDYQAFAPANARTLQDLYVNLSPRRR